MCTRGLTIAGENVPSPAIFGLNGSFYQAAALPHLQVGVWELS